MRLLALTHSLSPIDGVGKYAVAVLGQAKRFTDSQEVLLGRKHRGIASDLAEGVRVRPILPPDYFMYLSKPRFFAYLLVTLPRVLAAARRTDLIHCLCDYPFSVLAWLAGKAAKKPVVVSGHGTYSVAPFRYPLHRTLIRRSYAGVNAVIFGSSFARGKFEEHLRLDHVGVVDYGIDVSAYAGPAPPPPARVKRPFLLCIGEIKERKGHDISLRAFLGAAAKHPDLSFAVVGNHREGDPYFEALRRLAAEAGCAERVRFLGNVAEEEKRALLAHCVAFILTPKQAADGSIEALGLVFLEAGASGAPVIGTYDSGAVCAIEPGRNGYLIAPERPDEGAEAIGALLADPERRRRMGEEGRAMALARQWSVYGGKLQTIYKRALAGEPPFER